MTRMTQRQEDARAEIEDALMLIAGQDMEMSLKQIRIRTQQALDRTGYSNLLDPVLVEAANIEARHATAKDLLSQLRQRLEDAGWLK